MSNAKGERRAQYDLLRGESRAHEQWNHATAKDKFLCQRSHDVVAQRWKPFVRDRIVERRVLDGIPEPIAMVLLGGIHKANTIRQERAAEENGSEQYGQNNGLDEPFGADTQPCCKGHVLVFIMLMEDSQDERTECAEDADQKEPSKDMCRMVSRQPSNRRWQRVQNANVSCCHAEAHRNSHRG